MDDADDEGVSFVFTIQPSLSLHRQADDDPMAGGDEYDNDDDTNDLYEDEDEDEDDKADDYDEFFRQSSKRRRTRRDPQMAELFEMMKNFGAKVDRVTMIVENSQSQLPVPSRREAHLQPPAKHRTQQAKKEAVCSNISYLIICC